MIYSIKDFGPADLLTEGGRFVRRIKTESSFPDDLLAGNRLRVDVGEAGFYEGRQFRIDYLIDIPSGATRVIKFETGGDTLLLSSLIDIDDGAIDYSVYAGGVEGGTFGDPVTIWKTNLMSTSPAPEPRAVVTTGGTLDASGVEANTRIRLRTSNSSAQRETVSGIANDLRGFPSTTAYIVMKSLGGAQGAISGTLKLRWEER